MINCIILIKSCLKDKQRITEVTFKNKIYVNVTSVIRCLSFRQLSIRIKLYFSSFCFVQFIKQIESYDVRNLWLSPEGLLFSSLVSTSVENKKTLVVTSDENRWHSGQNLLVSSFYILLEWYGNNNDKKYLRSDRQKYICKF